MRPSRLIDTQITEPLFFLGLKPTTANPAHVRQRQLPWRNLRRGSALGLPSGEAVARHLGLQPIPVTQLQQHGITPTPLWYYVLAEAAHSGGQHLGEVGARIVTEVVLGLLRRDRFSFLRVEPAWKPFLGRPDGSTPRYTLADLVAYAQGH